MYRLLIPSMLLVFLACDVEAQPRTLVLHLWKGGAPGYESRRNEPELAKDYWVKNIQNPSITVYFPPAGKANGAAVLICPGGGHRELVYNAEGRDPALFFDSLGVTGIVLKYRLAREEGSPYQLEKEVKQDVFRAMRLIRFHAKEWRLDSNRLGVMGFSAGGELASMLAFGSSGGHAGATDPVDRLNAHPDFLIQIYPGPAEIPDSLPPQAPPAFLLAANDDPCCAVSVVKLLALYRSAHIPVEMHLFAQGSHAFNMGYRSSLRSIHDWPSRLADWLVDNHIILKKVESDR